MKSNSENNLKERISFISSLVRGNDNVLFIAHIGQDIWKKNNSVITGLEKNSKKVTCDDFRNILIVFKRNGIKIPSLSVDGNCFNKKISDNVIELNFRLKKYDQIIIEKLCTI